jgi:hypothetical protein
LIAFSIKIRLTNLKIKAVWISKKSLTVLCEALPWSDPRYKLMFRVEKISFLLFFVSYFKLLEIEQCGGFVNKFRTTQCPHAFRVRLDP